MASVHQIWLDSLDEIKNRVIGRTVWETLDAVQPITEENDVIILGIPHLKASLAGHLGSATNKNTIEQVLTDKYGKRVTVRVIEGVTQKDWEEVKQREEAARTLEKSTYERHQKDISSSAAWDELHDTCARKYATYANRSLAHVRGTYIYDCIQLIVETLSQIGEPDESAERNFARVLERVAQNAEVESAVIGYFVQERLRQLGK